MLFLQCCLLAIVLVSVVQFAYSAPAVDSSSKSDSDSLVPVGPCKEWCSDHCNQQCKKKGYAKEGVKAECHSDVGCYCECPANDKECSSGYCDKFCNDHSNGKKLESAKCTDKDTCQCKFCVSDGQSMMPSN
ncbi:hypothetical protein M3Y94_01274600 [Aphelenchoides besseyi]|nr:hypothetical protein M3Y94_01274600 [Aphelenchoides besseyi]KAI6222667.1 hypothetical protein M3Y95_00917800 [Aphelenchoides besseyi]